MSLPSLQARLNRAVFATTLCALLLSAASLLAFEGVTVRDALVQDLSTQADLIARSVAAALAFDDPHTAQESVELLRQRPRILSATVLRANGKRFAGFGGLPETKNLLGSDPMHRLAGSHLAMVYPVVQDGDRLGWVVVEAEHDLWERLFHYALIEAVVTLVALTLAFAVFHRLQRSITRPLLHVVGVASLATSRRDWSLRAGDQADNTDVSNLLDAFNRQAIMIEARRFLAGTPVPDAIGKNLDVLRVGHPKIDQPQVSILPVQPQDFLEAHLVDVEVERLLEIFRAKRNMREAGESCHEFLPELPCGDC